MSEIEKRYRLFPSVRRRNREKAAMGLIGLLSGISADDRFNEQEALYLTSWIENNEFLKNDPDAFDLFDAASDALEDGVITSDERQDMLSLARDIAYYRREDIGSHADHHSVNELLGILQGMAADRVVNTKEAAFLMHWIDTRPDLVQEWPIPDIQKRLELVLEDGHVDREESESLIALFRGITGDDFENTGMAGGLTAWSFLEDAEEVDLMGANVCFTGTFSFCNRKQLMELAEKAGATPKTSISRKVSYLFVGSILNPDWMFSSHGRKIQKALEVRKEGSGIRLLCEDCFRFSLGENRNNRGHP